MYIGVDLGTSAVKTLLMDEAGSIKKIVSSDYPIYYSNDGWSEQEPKHWWEAVRKCLRELAENVNTEDIGALSFSGQMHGLVILDENDSVIRRAILWNDQRTQAQCDYLNNITGRDKLVENTANIALTGFTAPKILWMKENEPELFKKIKKIMLPKDYIAYMLTGVHATDYSDASGMLLLDVKNRKWSEYMLDAVGINKGVLAGLYESYSPIGNISAFAAAETGLSVKTKVVIGGGDQSVGAVGTGTVSNNMCSVSLGTSGVVFAASDKFTADYGSSALHSFCHSPGNYHMMGVTLAAAASNKWWIEDILQSVSYDGEQDGIKKLGENKVFFLPYLSGERTPHNDPYARGAFVGLSMTTTRSDMTQAVMEGVAFSLRDVLEAMRVLGINPECARIIGGGAKSPLWRQMMADILNISIETINSDEGPALGAAILAAVGDGTFPSVADACAKLIKVTGRYGPTKENVSSYNGKYSVFTKLYADLKDSFKMM